MRRVAVILLLVLCFQGTFALAKRTRSSPEPIVVEAKRLVANNKAGWVRFEGDVVAVKGDMRIKCDLMKVFFNKGKVERIEANGNVVVHVKDRVIKSGKATYYAVQDKVVFEGHPQAWRGANMVEGEKIIYFVKDDRSIVEGGSKEGKVKAVIVPEEAKKGASGK